MLNRRHYRIKTLQALYAFFLSENDDVRSGEKHLMQSLQKLHELYIQQLSLLLEIREFAEHRQDDARQKYFPTAEELNPNSKFINNRFLVALMHNIDYQRYFQQYKINWSLHPELIRNIFLGLKDTEEYTRYMQTRDNNPAEDAELVAHIVYHLIDNNEVLEDIYEDKSIYWGADFSLSVFLVLKTLRQFTEQHYRLDTLPGLYKEADKQEEDLDFMKQLFRKTIIHSQEYDQLIQSRLENWELERIAVMDSILIRMALCELQEFPSIPVKVTLNEYIDISKSFSTPKSNAFINGILDKLLSQLQQEKKVNKRGRGLMQ